MINENVVKLFKAHQIGLEDMASYLRMTLLVPTNEDEMGLTGEQKEKIRDIINSAVVLPTRILKEFPNG